MLVVLVTFEFFFNGVLFAELEEDELFSLLDLFLFTDPEGSMLCAREAA